MSKREEPVLLSAGQEMEGVRAYVGLGSNMGDSRALLAAAREKLDARPELQVTAVSSLYLTEPQGDRDQPFFLNQAICVSCPADMEALDFLQILLDVETSLGRERTPGRRFGPRTMDLDLLLFGNARMDTERLVLPHPRLLERAFALLPLAEIAPGLALPSGQSVEEALAGLSFCLDDGIILQNAGPLVIRDK